MHLESQLRRAFHLSAPEIPEEGWASFAERAVVQVYEKNQILKKEGAPERFLHFILEGSAGVFLETAHQDICIDLCFEGEFLVDYLSLLTRQPTQLYTKSLEPLRVATLSRDHLMELYTTPLGEKIRVIVAESLFIHKQQQQVELLSLTAEQRYRKMLDEHPEWVSRTAQIHLASLLGVTPESLSRIRKKVSGN
ncbi:MAG: Crp/Fnr family transcriptional regulator [Haliscomenobacter sp.]|nr:Crp/Fnr family transcriptional regulator [Haliscomenobacter sp.]MBP9076392.1 Crp/Fnr family transcriptional regulator [Haliscomenobacter sp.]